MNLVFHAAAGATLGALALGPGAAPADLALCAVAGTSPDWDGALFFLDRPAYSRFHRTATHSVAGVILGGLLAGAVVSLWGGWPFLRAAGLWWLGAAGHTAADLFNRQGVALLHPFSPERTRFPAVSWGCLPLTSGAVAAALAVLALPEASRGVALAAVAGYVVYLRYRLRRPYLQDPVSRWWFGRVCGLRPGPQAAGEPPGFPEATENR